MAKSGLKLDVGPLQKAIEKTMRETEEARQEALDQAAEIVTGEAKREDVCPYKTGALADSHTWERGPAKDQRTIGANTTYAAAVHARHKEKPQWLLRTVLEKGPEIITKAIEVAMRRRRLT